MIGKAKFKNDALNLDDDIKVLKSELRGYNSERKDEEGTRYDIENAKATIDFENKTCVIVFEKRWIGGLVEKEKIEFSIEWQEKNLIPDIITEITIVETK